MPWTVKDVDKHKKGLTDKQKRQWVKIANSVYKQCMSDGGSDSSCAGKAIRQASGSVGNQETVNNKLEANSYQIRRESWMGESYLVVPVVMLIEGVHNGSGGRMLHIPEEMAKAPDGWDGRPVCINHPQREGILVSCNSPEFLENITVGTLFNTRWDGRLVSDAWLGESRLRQICPEVLFAVEKGAELEVSTGYFSDKEFVEGNWNGEQYEGIEHNYVPDHLAILTSHEGACSLADGCGLGVNEEGGEHLTEIGASLFKAITNKGYSVIRMTACEAGYGEVMEAIQLKLNALDEPDKAFYLVDVFSDNFVYEVRTMGASALYKRRYSMNNGKVEFNGEPEKVARKVEYVTQQTANEGGEKVERKKKPCDGCDVVIASLIANEATKWKEEDKDKLMALGEDLGKEFLEDMVPVEIETEKPSEEVETEEPEETPEVNQEDALKALKGQLSDPKQFLELLAQEQRGAIEYAMDLHKAERDELIGNISKAQSGFTEMELQAKDTGELRKISGLIKTADYSGLSGGSKSKDSVKPMIPPMAKKKE